jgi:hypothetical protein
MTETHIVPTASNARKLLALKSMMNIEIELIVKELAELDLHDFDTFRAKLPTAAKLVCSLNYQPIIQYCADYNWRNMILASDNEELMRAMLFSALASPIRPIIIVPKEPYPELIMKWRKLLKSMDIDFQQVDDRFTTVEKDVVLCVPSLFSGEVMKLARSSMVLIEFTKRKEQLDMFGLLPSIKGLLDTTYLGYELPHLIIGTSEPFNSRLLSESNNPQWYNSSQVYDALHVLYPNEKIDQYIGELHDSKRFQDMLLKNGLVLGSRTKMIQFMGVNTELLHNK